MKLGLRTKRLIDQLLNLQNFSLESERLSSYSHSWRVGAPEDTVREICDGSHQIQSSARGIAGHSYVSHRIHPSAKRITRRSYGVTSDPPVKDTVLQTKKTRICLVRSTVLSNGSGRRKACQVSAQDKGKQPLQQL